MPIYAYKCGACGKSHDALQKMSDAPLAICPHCSEPALVKQVTAAGFQLKGSGWYVTDFRDGSKAAPASKSGDESAAVKSPAEQGGSGAAAPATSASSGESGPSKASGESASGAATSSTASASPSTPASGGAGSSQG